MITIQMKLKREYWKNLQYFKREIEQENPGWIRQRRKNYLRIQMFECLKNLIPFYQWYNEATQREVKYILKTIIGIFAEYEKWERKLKKTKLEYDNLDSPDYIGNGISRNMIERAKEYPIEEIIEVNRQKFCCCPFHDERTPSFKIYPKTNTYHCFGCNISGDNIDLYIRLHQVNFKQAVRVLSKY